MKADIAVFDPDRVGDLATFEQPHQCAVGIEQVVVNGQVVFESGAMTAAAGARPARTRNPSHQAGPVLRALAAEKRTELCEATQRRANLSSSHPASA